MIFYLREASPPLLIQEREQYRISSESLIPIPIIHDDDISTEEAHLALTKGTGVQRLDPSIDVLSNLPT
jgi:hypothetical protein